MDKMECKKKILTTFGILFVFGIISIGTNGMLELGYGQTNSTGNQNQTSASNITTNNTTAPSIITTLKTNSTGNQTSASTAPANSTATPETITPAQEKASSSIKGAISETGVFLGNVTQKVTTSKSAGALLNDTSNALGNVYVETKEFFNPN
ncbi:hypothetical protein [Candidatus Nitrosocosmicus arcticus]|uniref:Uncharacterized protein n=1 Tax=Candidatus Nitrosocosmicus arcticus TaxID=2035267 RepID=A0A557SWP6_9ARCH|nr:hypothetical protein [Candidatus Nitrosocosmicus arcticus]TVP41029.1 hypothetical protein NARC_50210 [Candidatus Nitrosocosmicus arcticus]